MPKAALICGEPVRSCMAGIGVRYLEMARHLPELGIDSVLVSPGTIEQLSGVSAGKADIRCFKKGQLEEAIHDCTVVIAQGQSATCAIKEVSHLPIVIDLYDPWLIENLHYSRFLGNAPFENDHGNWMLQMSRGDFFLCSSEEQRKFYLRFLTALKRINPGIFNHDPVLESLIAVVPFGIPDALPQYKPYLPDRLKNEKRILFGGIYDWLDPWVLLEALEKIDNTELKVFFINSPNPETTPQKTASEVEKWCRERGWLQNRVQMIDWVPFERRYDFLRDVDLLVAPHLPSIEDQLSLRTRYIEAMAVRCPVIASEGGAISHLLERFKAGWIVPPKNSDTLAEAIKEALGNSDERGRRINAADKILESFRWENVLRPFVSFCQDPHKDLYNRSFENDIDSVKTQDDTHGGNMPLICKFVRLLRNSL
ncbi:MAG: glycosyltransferase family 4 protein [Candidatus Theseobacter exili]|nr:glycosyltransferase family 4 protein [Candidatus Theseobacter exili]